MFLKDTNIISKDWCTHVHVHFSMLKCFSLIHRWLGVRLEFIGNLVVFFAALFATIEVNYQDTLKLPIDPGRVGLSISYAMQVQ